MQSADEFFKTKLLETRHKEDYQDYKPLLIQHNKYFAPRRNPDYTFLWALLRFSENGQVQTISDATDLPVEAADDQLSQLLASSTGDYQFQLLVRRVGHFAPLRVNELRILNSAFHISEVVWRNLFVIFPPNKVPSYRKTFAQHGVLPSEADALYIAESYLCVPGSKSESSCKTVIIFLCQPNLLMSSWWLGGIADQQSEALPKNHFDEYFGEYGMLKWISFQAKYRACSTAEDFTFLCAEALLRAELQAIVVGLTSFRDTVTEFGSWIGSNSKERSFEWLELDMRLAALRNVLELLVPWLKDHVHDNKSSQEDFRMKCMIRYKHAADESERLLQVCKHQIDLEYANLSASNAFESIREIKFSKILTVLAIVYLPVSIASSIFGMNVQELNGQGLQIRWFVVAIFITMGALLVCWLVFALITNQRSHVKSQDPSIDEHWYSYNARPWKHRIWGIDLSRRRVARWPVRMHRFIAPYNKRFRDWINGIRETSSQAVEEV